MGASNILGGLLMGLGQSRARLNREEFEREQKSLEKMRGLAIGLMDKVPPGVQQELAALSMESLQGKMNSRKFWERLQPLVLGTKPTPVPGTGREVPPRTVGSGPGPQLRQIAPPPAAMGGGPVAAGAEGMPLRPPLPPPLLPSEMGIEATGAGTPEVTTPGFTMPPVPEEMGPFAQKAAMEEQAELEKLRATERIKREEAMVELPGIGKVAPATVGYHTMIAQLAAKDVSEPDKRAILDFVAQGLKSGLLDPATAHRELVLALGPTAATEQMRLMGFAPEGSEPQFDQYVAARQRELEGKATKRDKIVVQAWNKLHRAPTQYIPGYGLIDMQSGDIILPLDIPTAATRTMQEAAPKVTGLADRVLSQIEQQRTGLGPAVSRWNEFMVGTVGAPNEEFTRLRANVALLTTLLLRMHVGARGGQLMMQHFKDLMNVSIQSPENLRAAVQEVRHYAQAVQGLGTEVSGTVQMRTPDGTTWNVPPDRVTDAERRGAKRVQ